jgi:hypothetical protein
MGLIAALVLGAVLPKLASRFFGSPVDPKPS